MTDPIRFGFEQWCVRCRKKINRGELRAKVRDKPLCADCLGGWNNLNQKREDALWEAWINQYGPMKMESDL